MLTLDRRGWLLEVPLGLHHILSALCLSDGLLWKRPLWWLQLGKGSQELKGDPKYDRNFNLHLTGCIQSRLVVNHLWKRWHTIIQNTSYSGSLSRKEMDWETWHDQVNDSMFHSSQILSEFTLLLLNFAITMQDVGKQLKQLWELLPSKRQGLWFLWAV
jgi:hypothetical protein